MIQLKTKLSYTLYLVLSTFIFQSCERSTDILDVDSVLIIKEIEKNDYTYKKTKYKVNGVETKQGWTTSKFRNDGFLFYFYDDDGKFEVGDTIYLSNWRYYLFE